jgi:hypothetical protein
MTGVLRSRRAERLGTTGDLRTRRRAAATAAIAVLVTLIAPASGAPQPLGEGAGSRLAYYVAPGAAAGGCSDARTFMQARRASTPWCSVDKAAAAAPKGATVYVRGGKYEHFTTKNKCRSGWVTFKPYPHQTVTLDGAHGGADDSHGGWELFGDCYIRIQGFNLTDRFFLDGNQSHIDIVGNHVYSKDSTPDVRSGSANLTVSGVVTRCSGPKCSSGQSDITIRGNRFDHIAYNCLGTGSNANACDSEDNNPWGYGYCVRPWRDMKNLVIAGNRINGCWEDAIQGVASGTVISRNNISGVVGGASGHQDGIQIFSASSNNTAIIGNNFHGDQSTCVRIQDGVRTHFTIVDNICAGNVSGQCFDLEDLHDSLFAYNTCGTTKYGSGIEDDADVPGRPDHLVVENNIFGDAIKGVSLGIDAGITNFVNRYNIRTEPAPHDSCSPGCISRQPRFVNPQGGADMRLRPDSVGIDAGIDDSVKVDILGRPRVVDTPRRKNRGAGGRPYSDIGAYELQKKKKKKRKHG